MKTLTFCVAVCLFATTSFAQELNWTELARRPELWPVQCSAKQEMKFDGGIIVRAGDKLTVLKITASEAQVQTTDARATFETEPGETDLLAVAQAAYAKLTPKQRALTYESLVRQKELWPQHVTLKKTFDMGGGRAVREGDQVVLQEVLSDRLSVVAENIKTRFQVVPQATDLMAQARKLVEDANAAPRFVDAQKKEQENQIAAQQVQRAQPAGQEKKPLHGPVIAELEPELVSSITGKPAPFDEKAMPRYVVLYRGSSTCPITRQFTPTLIKYYQQMKPSHPEFEVVYIMTETVEATNKFAKEIGFSWRAIPYQPSHPMPLVRGPIHGLLPQLIVLDRNGRVLANGVQNSAGNALRQLDMLLKSSASQPSR